MRTHPWMGGGRSSGDAVTLSGRTNPSRPLGSNRARCVICKAMKERGTMATRTPAKTPAQTFALVFGGVYLLIGIVGFFVTGFDGFAAKSFDEKLILFPLNPLHNIVHIGVGALWLAGAARHDSARSVNTLIGAVYGLVTILGFAGVLEFLAIESGSADNFLHLASAGLALYFGTAGARSTSPATA
jgi:hypothetical protein